MAKEKVAGLLATEVGLNTTSATKSLNELKSAVKDSTNEWKQMESQMKQSGDEIGASEAKYKGLTQSVNQQQDVLAKLRQEQSEVNRSTEAGEQTYQKYATQITTAERQLASMTKQQEQAKRAYELQESGIAGLNKEIQNSIKETDAYVERLRAEGKEEEANEAQKKGLARTLEKQSDLYEAQRKQLDKMTQSGEASADSISKQKIALDKTGTSIAKGKQSLAELDLEQSKIGQNDGAEKSGGKFQKLTGVVGGTKAGMVALTASAAVALAGVSKVVSSVYDQQAQVNELQAKTTATYKQSRESIKSINELYAQGYGESVEELTETFTKIKQLNPEATTKELTEQTKLVSTYAKQSGADVQEVLNGADKATRSWHISYQEYFDNMTQLQKMGDDQAGDISDNMAEYSQVLGQMGLSMKDSMALIDNGVKSGAYNGDKLLDFTKEFQISLNDGRMDEAIENFSQKSQDMFKGYKDGSVSAGDMFKQITSEMGKMTDKQKEATIASDLWSALGEDNSLAVLESLGKQNKAFDDTAGTAKKTAEQLKESNPFELMKRSAEASMSSMTMNATQTKEFKKALKPLQKAMEDFIKTAVDNLPKIVKAITPVIQFVADNGKLIMTIMTTMLALNFTGKAINGISNLHGSIKDLMPTVTNAAKKGKNAFKWTASLGKKAFMGTLNGLKTATVATGEGIGKSVKWTASIATKGAKLALTGLLKTAKLTGKGIKLAFNFLKANPLILLVTAITAVVVALVELYKHNKKFRKFVNDLVASAKKFFNGVIKFFTNAWKSVTKGFNSFNKSFSKGWDSFTDWIGKTWNNGWKYVGNVFDKYINIFKKTLKLFTDFFTGNWGNLAKDLRNVWNALWGYLESIFGNKVNSIKRGVENFGSSIWNLFGRIKNNVSNFWSNMWDGLKNFARDGINGVIGIINGGIGGINSVIHTFGGKANAISKIPKFANGTKGAPKGLAIVNDAPGEHYKEAIIDNSGKATVLEGRNRLVNFSGGETVIPAHALPHFADGTDGWLDTAVGWIKDKWDKLTEFIAHPIMSLGNIMNKAVENIYGSALVTNVAPAMGNGFVQGILEPIVNLFKSLKKKHDDEGQQTPAGSGVHRWKDQVVSALKANGLSISDGMVNKVLRQIATESGGNEKAVQGGYTDINTITGDLAKGLMQTISATFNAYKFPGHGNIFNGYDNLLAALNYAKHRYGSDLSFLGQGHGYENGGIVSTHGLYEVAERNMPEIIIPLDPAKKMRANDLLEQANARINGNRNSGQAQIVQEGDTYQIEINVNADLTPNTLKRLQQEFEDAITRKQNAKSRAFG